MVEELRVVPSAMSLELSCRPPGWQNVPIHRTCCNCETYGWTFDKQDVQQCQRCKGVTYCSKVLTMDLHDHFSQQTKQHQNSTLYFNQCNGKTWQAQAAGAVPAARASFYQCNGMNTLVRG